MPSILGANTLSSGGYAVDHSLRFNSASSDSLEKTFSSAGNRRTFTMSCWVKRSSFNSHQRFFGWKNNGGGYGLIWENTDGPDQLRAYIVASGSNAGFLTNRKFRDPAAWYHIVLKIDTTQGTEANRMRLYINGVEETSFESRTYPNQNEETHLNLANKCLIGQNPAADNSYLNGYLCEVVFIDGTALDADSFGEFDEDSEVWKPIDVSGLTFGQNGFYLESKGVSTGQNSNGLGADTSGNDHHFATSGFSAIDRTTDTCTNNFCTINSLDNFYAAATLAEGNLKVTCNAGNTSFITGTFGLSKGKWYWEGKLTTVGGEEAIGITDKVSTATDNYAGQTANSYSFKGNNGNIRNNDNNSSYGSAYGASVIGVYMDLDNNKLYFAINGTIQNSGTGHSITAAASTTNGVYFPMVGDVDSDAPVWEVNFGNPVSALSSAVSDANGYGSFEYDPSAGTFDSASKDFLAICTKNLATDG